MQPAQPIAFFGDTVSIVAAIFAVRLVLVRLPGVWAELGALWARRLAVMVMLLLVLRLGSMAVSRPADSGPLLWLIGGIVLAGAALLIVDHILVDLLRTRRRQ